MPQRDFDLLLELRARGRGRLVHGQRGKPLFRRGWARSARVAVMLGIMSLLVVACAQVPPSNYWEPPHWEDAAGAHLVNLNDEPGDETPAAATEALNDLGFVDQRVRNDFIKLQARYVEIPGATAFNSRVSEIVWTAIRPTGKTYVPEVFPVSAGLGDRGCVTGAMHMEAAELLTDKATGPTGGDGTAIVCEVTEAYGNKVGVAMRTVTGSEGKITEDSRVTLIADLSTGEVFDGADRWNSNAAPELWTLAVEQLRRAAGGMSTAPIASPDEEQVKLSEKSFEAVLSQAGGGAVLTLPPGITSPELVGLGVTPTTGPTSVAVEPEVLETWLSEQAGRLAQEADTPFVGLPKWNASLPVDCALAACISVTYDDGPSEYTDDLLDTLRNQQAAATFFMMGSRVTDLPKVAERVASEGHEIGSHTMTHPDLTTLKLSDAEDEVIDAAKAITKATGAQVPFYRPPYGAINDKILNDVKLPAILWSIDTLDWQTPGTEALVQRSVGEAEVGDIILFHDIHEETVDSADVVLQGLRDRGFTPVTVTELFDGAVPSGRVFGR